MKISELTQSKYLKSADFPDPALCTIKTVIKENVAKLRELSPLWEMFKDGVDLSTIQWAAH